MAWMYKLVSHLVNFKRPFVFCSQDPNKEQQVNKLLKIIISRERSPDRFHCPCIRKILSVVCLVIALLAAVGCIVAGVFDQLEITIAVGVFGLMTAVLLLVCGYKARTHSRGSLMNP